MSWNSVQQNANLCLVFGSDYWIPVTLQEISDPVYGWTMSINLDQIARDPRNVPSGGTLKTDKTITYFKVGFNATTGGNWNIDQPTGKNSPVIFSRAPLDVETTAMSADWQACRDGVRPVGATYAPPAIGQTSCNNDAIVAVHAERPIDVMLPPTSTVPLDYGRLTGPSRIAGTSPAIGSSQTPNLPEGFGLVRGTNTAPVTWTQPGGPAGGVRQYGLDATLKGYVLVVSSVGDQDGRYFKRFDTQQFLVDSNNNVIKDSHGNPVPNPDFDKSGPCGSDGTGNCSFALKFPLTGVGGHILTGNGKYDTALVTIYSDGFRTDGLCDDGTGPGAVCPSNMHGHYVVGTGISSWQFWMRSDSYANAYMEYYITQVRQSNGSKPSGCAWLNGSTDPDNTSGYGGCGAFASLVWNMQPRFLLLVDYPTKRADFIIWGQERVSALNSNLPFVQSYTGIGNQAYGPGADFAGSSDLIQGSADSGVVSFGNFKPDGGAASFHFDGITNVNVVNSSGVTISGTPCSSLFVRLSTNPGAVGGTKQACGVFTLYDPRQFIPGQVNPFNLNAPVNTQCVGAALPKCLPVTTEEPFEGVKI